jgi:4-hydroxybenzoyl-CoA reductase subunit beta
MMRLPEFRFVAPRTVEEAVDVLASHAPGDAMVVAGGTDLLPNMKRRQQTPKTLIGLRRVGWLRQIVEGPGLTLGAGLTLTDVVRNARVASSYRALHQAASLVATPHLRNMGTLGGNICLDTRCNYYDQNYEWRKSIDFCMKRDGATCWVATSSPRCLAVSSTDTAPALMALDAEVTLASATGVRHIAIADLYRNDGIHYLTRRPDEILTAVRLPRLDGWRSTYVKLRRRGSFDFPVLSVAAAVKLGANGTVEAARIVLGAVASRPVAADKAAAILVGGPLSDDAIARAAALAAKPARPMDNTDFTLLWRKRVTREYVTRALKELRAG